jgi:hypothetical protein
MKTPKNKHGHCPPDLEEMVLQMCEFEARIQRLSACAERRAQDKAVVDLAQLELARGEAI